MATALPPPPAPARPLGPVARPRCCRLLSGRRAGLELPGWACARRDSVAGVRGPPAAPRVTATSGPRAALGARGWPPHPHPTPTPDKLSHPARVTRLLRRTPELPTPERAPEGEAGGRGCWGEEPRSSFPSEIKQVCLPPLRSLSLGQEEPTYLGGKRRVGGIGFKCLK